MTSSLADWTPLPPDGAWHRTEWFREVASECGSASLVERAQNRLLPIFTPEWARALPKGTSKAHPFLRLYVMRHSIAEILALGRALDILGSPPELTRDLAHAERFSSRAAEAWTGALFAGFGAKIEFIDETRAGKKCPEFIAHFPSGCVSVEHKGLLRGEDDHRHLELGMSYFWGIQDVCHSEANRDLPPSSCIADCSREELADIVESEDEAQGLEHARERGRALAREVVDFLRSHPKVGAYELRPGLHLQVYDVSANHSQGLQLHPALSSPSGKSIARRLTRSSLKHAAAKFKEWKLPGIIVIERKDQEHLGRDVMEVFEKDVAKGQPWTKNVAAIFACNQVSEPDDSTKRNIPRSITIIPGPRASELPQPIQSLAVPCQTCKRAHFVYDVLDEQHGA